MDNINLDQVIDNVNKKLKDPTIEDNDLYNFSTAKNALDYHLLKQQRQLYDELVSTKKLNDAKIKKIIERRNITKDAKKIKNFIDFYAKNTDNANNAENANSADNVDITEEEKISIFSDLKTEIFERIFKDTNMMIKSNDEIIKKREFFDTVLDEIKSEQFKLTEKISFFSQELKDNTESINKNFSDMENTDRKLKKLLNTENNLLSPGLTQDLINLNDEIKLKHKQEILFNFKINEIKKL